MTRSFAFAVAAGLLAALLFLSLLKGIAMGMLLSYAAPLPLMMAGLALGQTAAVVAGAVGTAAVGLVAGGMFSALPFLVAAVLPALVVSNRSLLWRQAADGIEWYPPGRVLAWLTAAGIALIAVGAALVPDHPEGAKGWVAHAIGRTLEMLAPEAPSDQRRQAVEWWTPLFPAMVAGSWLVMAALNAVAAQGLLKRLGRNRRPCPAYRDLDLPDWSGMVLAAAMALGLLAEGSIGYAARNAAVVATVPFVFLGVAGIHRWAAGRANARFVLTAFYVVLVVAFAWAVVPIAGLGLVRFWTMRFRRREGGGEEG